MIDMLELALIAIALAWLGLIAAMVLFLVKINHEKQEISRIKEKVDVNEKSVKKISGFFVAIKNELSSF